jgi:hypothetical protein
MERSNFFDDQYVFAEDQNNIHVTLGSQSVKRSQAPLGDSGGYGKFYTYITGSVSKGGIYGSPSDYLLSKNFKPIKEDVDEIKIAYPGIAIFADGNLANLTGGDLSILLGGTQTPSSTSPGYSWVGTGSALSVQNYIKLKYFEVSGSIKTDDDGVSHATRYYDSFLVEIDETSPSANEILLGTFLAGGGGEINGDITDRRLYCRTITTADSVSLDPTYRTVATHNTVEDHVMATGSATPTTHNPHGISYADLGDFNSTPSPYFLINSGGSAEDSEYRFGQKSTGSLATERYASIQYHAGTSNDAGFRFYHATGSAVASPLLAELYVSDVFPCDHPVSGSTTLSTYPGLKSAAQFASASVDISPSIEGTWTQNTEVRPLFINAIISSTTGQALHGTILVSSTSGGTSNTFATVDVASADNTQGMKFSISAIVPPSWWYQINAAETLDVVSIVV